MVNKKRKDAFDQDQYYALHMMCIQSLEKVGGIIQQVCYL